MGEVIQVPHPTAFRSPYSSTGHEAGTWSRPSTMFLRKLNIPCFSTGLKKTNKQTKTKNSILPSAGGVTVLCFLSIDEVIVEARKYSEESR